jgi:hypothetical protein
MWNSCSVFSDFLFTNKVGLILRGNEQIPLYVLMVFCALLHLMRLFLAHTSCMLIFRRNTNRSRRTFRSPRMNRRRMIRSRRTRKNYRRARAHGRKTSPKRRTNRRLRTRHPRATRRRAKRDRGKHRTKRQETADKSSKMAPRFKATFPRSDVRVHFIGVRCVSTVMAVVVSL